MYTATVLKKGIRTFLIYLLTRKKKMKKRINKLTSKLSTILMREEKMCKNKNKKVPQLHPRKPVTL